MAVDGLMANAKPYPLMIDTRVDSSAEAMIDDLTKGRDRRRHSVGTDGGLLCQEGEPAAPCYAACQGNDRTAARLSHRHGRAAADQNWKRQLNRLIQENQPAINKILLDFGVPLLDENDSRSSAETATKSP